MGILYLAGAIVAEVFGSSMLKAATVAKSKLPVIGIIFGFVTAFYLLSLALLTIPLSFAYAAWSSIGTALTAAVGFLIFKEHMNRNTVIGIVLLIAGVVLLRM